VRKRWNFPDKPVYLQIGTAFWDDSWGYLPLNLETLKIAWENCMKSLAEHRKPAYTARPFSITDVHSWRAVQ